MAKRVLLVEDQLVIALEAEQMLAELGAGEVSTAGSATEALHTLASTEIDVAVLDINLGSSSSIPVAEELKRRAIPFVFATGYGDTMMIPPSMARTRVVRKPYTATTLNETIAQALRDMDLL